MGNPLGPKYILYSYMDPLGSFSSPLSDDDLGHGRDHGRGHGPDRGPGHGLTRTSERQSNILVSILITPIILPFTMPSIAPFKESIAHLDWTVSVKV